MKILALDSSGLAASVAIMEDDTLIADYTIYYKKTHSQTLLPMLDEVCKMTELSLDSIDAIAVAAGPGSFTGLRIGSATAKGLGLALNKPVIAVPTVDALAYIFYGTDALICPIMDARRSQVYTGVYEFIRKKEVSDEQLRLGQSFTMECLIPQCAVSIDTIIEQLNTLGGEREKEVIFTGDGIPVFTDILREKLQIPWSLAPANRNRQSASALAALAQVYYQEGKIEAAAEHVPIYLRLSQAERERMEAEDAEKKAAKEAGASQA